MRKLLSLTALALVAGVAHADPDLYVGAAVTKTKIGNVFQSGLDTDNTDWKAIVGFKPPLFPVGAEAEYLDLGSQTRLFANAGGIGVHSDAKAFAAYAVGYLPLPLPIVSFFGKAGLARWELSGSSQPGLFSLSDHGTQFTWGVGAQAHYGKFAGRLEYERFNISNTDGANVVSLGVTYTLL
jgi:hypothetical protein